MQDNINQEYNEITFASIGRFLKKSFVISLIVVVICCLAFSVIYGSLFLAGNVKNKYLNVQMEYSHKGVEQGLDPLGETLNYNAIKSVANVEKTLKKLNKEANTQEIISNIFVTPIVPAEVVNSISDELKEKMTINKNTIIFDDGTKFYANKYNIVFRYDNLEKTKMTDKEANLFMNELFKQYQIDFIDIYSAGKQIPSAFFREQYKGFDFFSYYTNAKIQLFQIEKFLMNQNESFVSPSKKISYGDMKAALQVQISFLESYRSFVVSNALAEDKDSVIANMQSSIDSYDAKITATESLIKGLSEQIAAYDSEIKLPGKDSYVVQIVKGEAYENLQNELKDYRIELAKLQENKAIITKDKQIYETSSGLNNTSENKAKAKAVRETINVNVLDIIEKLNVLNNEYMYSSLNENSIKTITPVTFLIDKPEIKDIILMYVIVIILSYALGLVIYKIVESRAKSKANKVVQQLENEILPEATTDEQIEE